MSSAEDDFDDLNPWERYEKLKEQDDTPAPTPDRPAAVAAEHLLAFWHYLLMGSFHGHERGASLTTVARVFKILSDADLLLSKLVGEKAIRVGVWFEPKFALEAAQDRKERKEDDQVTDTLRQVARRWQEAYPAGTPQPPPLSPHLLMAAMLYWAQGQPFTYAHYQQMMPRLFGVPFAELLVRLHLIEPQQEAAMRATVERVAQLPVKVNAPCFVRFVNRHSGEATRDFGPYNWIEMIHDELKVAPSGRHLATFRINGGVGYWEVDDPSIPPGAHYTNMISGPTEVSDGWPEQPELTAEGPGG